MCLVNCNTIAAEEARSSQGVDEQAEAAWHAAACRRAGAGRFAPARRCPRAPRRRARAAPSPPRIPVRGAPLQERLLRDTVQKVIITNCQPPFLFFYR